jgi:hypothetical protein
MARMRDPAEIYRESLASQSLPTETAPPTVTRVDVRPYPDLGRLWVRIQVSAFTRFPDLDVTVYDPDGLIACSMYMVEVRESYQSVTLHLRQPPRAGADYIIGVALLRDGAILDAKQLSFDLTFREL